MFIIIHDFPYIILRTLEAYFRLRKETIYYHEIINRSGIQQIILEYPNGLIEYLTTNVEQRLEVVQSEFVGVSFKPIQSFL